MTHVIGAGEFMTVANATGLAHIASLPGEAHLVCKSLQQKMNRALR
jgi:hypothetical protein